VHTGHGSRGGDDYVGIDVHRAARVAGAAHGGEILVTEATRSLAADRLGPDVDFRDLGAYRLKDLAEPMRLHRVVADGLVAGSLPPRAKRVGSLPAPRTHFIGRRAVLAELQDLLARARLLVLTGPGGVGKTRLALELARRVEDGHPDGAFFVPLEAVTDPRVVSSAVLQVMELQAGARPSDEALRDLLAPMQALLVLDNVEQIPGIGVVIDELLAAAPGLRMLVTSRVALRVYGEQEYRVPPLALPSVEQRPGLRAPDARRPTGDRGDAMLLDDAGTGDDSECVALFVDRARAARPAFQLAPTSAPVVAEICRQLDGLPLAIELAAARIRMLSPEAILARLDQRLRVLEDRAPNLPLRQRSIRGAIEWSYELLDPAHRRLLDRLGVFVGGWDLAAAEAVCTLEDDPRIDVLDGIGSLLDQSLVSLDTDGDETAEPRFKMLQTIRDYALERLSEAGEREVVGRRHAEYVRSLVEAAEPGFMGADPGGCATRLARDQDNIRAALGWAIDHDAAEIGLATAAAVWRLWQVRGQLAEGRRYLDALIALPSAAGSTPERARALTAAGGILYWQSDPGARARYEEARAIYEQLGDEAGVAESLSNLGYTAMTASPRQLELALTWFNESLERYRALGDQRMIASVTGAIGMTELGLMHPDAARQALEEALALNLAGGYRGRAADNRFALGDIHRLAQRWSDAAEMYGAALDDAEEMGDRTRTLAYLSAVASWAVDIGWMDQALRLAGAFERSALEQGGALVNAPGIVDPAEVARAQGIGDEVIAAELDAGRRLSLDEAVAFARDLLAGAGEAGDRETGGDGFGR
jgi:predicted ATPase